MSNCDNKKEIAMQVLGIAVLAFQHTNGLMGIKTKKIFFNIGSEHKVFEKKLKKFIKIFIITQTKISEIHYKNI